MGRPVPQASDPGHPAVGQYGESGAQGGELAEVRAQLREAYETIEAIRSGEVDSLVIGPSGQEQIYALTSADRPYRLIVAAMNEGAATISPRGIILDANPRLGAMTGQTGTQRPAPRSWTWSPAPTAPRSAVCSTSVRATAPGAKWS